MMFVLRMAVRETRASLRRLFFFFICIAVGVAAIVALRSVIQSVRGVFGSEAKSLIAADVLISTNREWTPDARATIDRRLADAGMAERTETIGAERQNAAPGELLQRRHVDAAAERRPRCEARVIVEHDEHVRRALRCPGQFIGGPIRL